MNRRANYFRLASYGMRLINFIFIIFFLPLPVFAEMNLFCKNATQNLYIQILSDQTSALCSLMDVDGNDTARGVMSCDGPMQSSVHCFGALQLTASTLTINETLLISAWVFQYNGTGPIKFGGANFYCNRAYF